MNNEGIDGVLAKDLIDAFLRLAKGDFSVRLARNFRRDTQDTLAFFVNLIAEELARLQSERERSHRELSNGIAHMSERFLSLASGDFSTRAERSGKGDPLDVLAFMFNNMADEVEEAFSELNQQRSVHEAILESMIDGLLLLDDHGTILRTNGALGRLLEHPLDSLVDRHISAILAQREADFASGLADLVSASAFRDRPTSFLSSRGEVLALSVNGSPRFNADGTLSGIVLLVRDDRELKKAQAQLQITDRMATMGTVAAGVAHEINNPLAFILGNLDYIREELELLRSGETLDGDELDDLLKAIEATRGGAVRVRDIVRDLRTFSRSDSDATATRLELNKVVDSALGLLRNELRHHARVVRDYGDPPPVRASEGRLVQVILNLIQNAAQAIPTGNVDHNEIRLCTGSTGEGNAFVEVRDTGSGISEEHLSRIFDLFFTTKPVGVGTGLGLSICHRIIEEIGGKIEVQSKQGEGSTFRVVLPPDENEALSMRPGARRSAAPRRRLLIIDDEREVGESARRILGRAHQIDIVSRAAEALDRLNESSYDLILCDLLMPEMTGMELHARIQRERPELVSRMAFMTGGAFSTDAREFLKKLDRPLLDKPFDAETLRAFVASALQTGP